MPTGRDLYFDVPLTNMAVRAFQSTDTYIGTALFPSVPVAKQSGKYYTVDKNTWLRVHQTLRAPKTSPRRIDFLVSSDAYYCDNHALAAEMSVEDLANADAALRLRDSHTMNVVDGLLRGLEQRIAQMVTSISNVGSGVALTGTAKFSDFINSDPIGVVTTGHAFIRQNTGLVPNTLVMDQDTYSVVRRHPALLDMYKYTSGGFVADSELAKCFSVDRLLIGKGILNNAVENATASLTNIWGNNMLLCRVVPGVSLETATFGLAFQWQPAGTPSPMSVVRYAHPDPGAKAEVLEAGYYQDEKVIAPALAYAITGTL